MDKKQTTLQEFEELMKKNNLSFSDIAKIANALKGGEVIGDDNTAASAKKVSTKPKYSISQLSYPDIVIRRETSKQIRELMIAPSCAGYCVRTLRNTGTWEIEKLTGDNYANFMSDWDEDDCPIELPSDFYITKFERGKLFGTSLLAYFDYENIIEMIKNKCAPKFDKEQFGERFSVISPYGKRDIRYQSWIYEKMPVIYKEYSNTENSKIERMIKENPHVIITIQSMYGLDKTREAIKHYDMSLFDVTTSINRYICGRTPSDFAKAYEAIEIAEKVQNLQYRGNSMFAPIPLMRMDFDAFIEYYFYEAYRMGYSSLSDFYRDWADTLQMQMDVYGKIKEKYPKLLPVYHNKLVRYKRNDKYYNHKEYQQAFEEKAAELQKYAYTPTKCDYMFVVPQTALAVVDEANQQSNCLVSAKYMDRVIDGTSVLVFMRPKNAPDTSCVTIEICGDKINQAYQASNRAPTNSQRNAIQKYAEHFDLRYCD